MPEQNDNDELTFTVGAREIYDKLRDIEQELVGVKDHESRLRSLEMWKAWLMGALAVAYGGLGYLFQK